MRLCSNQNFILDTTKHPGQQLIDYLDQGNALINIGVFNALSAAIASLSKEPVGLFLSGLGLTYGHLGWPDVGLLDPTDVVNEAMILRSNHVTMPLTVDIDSGLGGIEQLKRVIVSLRDLGVAMVQLEDQTLDDKRCGHLGDKKVRPIEDTIGRLTTALKYAHPMQVVARTDASIGDGALTRVEKFIEVGARIVLVDGINEEQLMQVKQLVNGRAHIMANQLYGGSLTPQPAIKLKEKYGVSIINFSTPLLAPAMKAMVDSMKALEENNWQIIGDTALTLGEANEIVTNNYNRFLQGRESN